MTDLLDNILAEWREVTDKAYRGPWYAGTEEGIDYGSVIGYPVTGEDGYDRTPFLVDDLSSFPGTAEFIATSRTAMPALLTAVEAVLKLHQPMHHGDYDPDIDDNYCEVCQQDGSDQWPCPTVVAIRDALGGDPDGE